MHLIKIRSDVILAHILLTFIANIASARKSSIQVYMDIENEFAVSLYLLECGLTFIVGFQYICLKGVSPEPVIVLHTVIQIVLFYGGKD